MIRVMVVEDDPMVMDITCRFIESIPGFQTCAKAAGAAEAMKLLSHKTIDLVVLDIYMPIMNGMEFLTKVRAIGLTLDVIFLTADNTMEMISNALKLGAVDYLIKPFSYERFKASLESYEKRFLMLQEQKQMTQVQLDGLFKPDIHTSDKQVQKGIHAKTLENVREYIKNSPQELLSQHKIAQALQLSKVTVRRYMEYLAAANEVVLQIEYGSVGRPAYVYKRL